MVCGLCVFMCVCVMKDAVLFSVAQTNAIMGHGFDSQDTHELIKIKYVLSESMQCKSLWICLWQICKFSGASCFLSSLSLRVRVCLGGLW